MDSHVPLVLDVLDQSPVFRGQSPAEAIAKTLRLAQEVEQLGYRRFWVSEHHGAHAYASASPEVMLARLGSVTSRLRIGAGGVLLRPFARLIASTGDSVTTYGEPWNMN